MHCMGKRGDALGREEVLQLGLSPQKQLDFALRVFCFFCIKVTNAD